MISSGGNVSHSSSGKQLTVNSCRGAKTRRPLWFSTYFWPATHCSFWEPEVIGWNIFSSTFRHIFPLLNSITWHYETHRGKASKEKSLFLHSNGNLTPLMKIIIELFGPHMDWNTPRACLSFQLSSQNVFGGFIAVCTAPSSSFFVF